MITSLVAAVILAAAALWCLLRPAPGPRALLFAHQLDEAQRQAELEALACTACVMRGGDRIPCDLHDGRLWDSFERRYHS